MSKIVIMEPLGISAEELALCKAPFEKQGHVFADYARTDDPEKMAEQAEDADVMILANMPMPAEVLHRCKKLKFIDVAFTGVDHIGLEAARERGIAVSNASGYSNEAVSELVLGMTLSMARSLRRAEDRCRAGEDGKGLAGWEIKGQTVGIIGLGKIGRRSAELFHAFGAHVLAQSRSYHSDAPDYVEQVSQDELLRRSDVVVLHCPLNASTRGMIHKEKLALMKSTALLINVARGPVVVEKDLADALKKGVIAGACVDVFDQEPPLDPSSALLNAPNCLVTPHIAFATRQSMSLRARIVFENLAKWLEGHQINAVL